MEKSNNPIIAETNKFENFFEYIFNFDEENKCKIMNIMQYFALALIPVIILLKLIKNYFPDFFIEQRKIVRNIVIYYIRLARQQLDVKTIFKALLTIITVFPDLQLPEIFIKEILYDQGFSQLDVDKRRWSNKKINIL